MWVCVPSGKCAFCATPKEFYIFAYQNRHGAFLGLPFAGTNVLDDILFQCVLSISQKKLNSIRGLYRNAHAG